MRSIHKNGISIIVSTYNWPEALALTLDSLNAQTVLPDEIVIADDGSRGETKAIVDSLIPQIKVPIVYCWQPDEGFRLAKVRNLALENCSYNYIIQIDGDIICDKNFIKDHLKYRSKGFFISGKRIDLNIVDTQKTLIGKKLFCSNESLLNNKLPYKLRNSLLMNAIKPKKINNLLNKGVLGCNMSYWLADALSICGYNEKMTGWGKEDDEFAQRLLNSGIQKRGIRFGAIQFHLSHQKDLNNLSANIAILKECQKKPK